MKVPDVIEVETKLKLFLKNSNVDDFGNETFNYRFDKKPYKVFKRFCKKMTKFGYGIKLKINGDEVSYKNGEIEFE